MAKQFESDPPLHRPSPQDPLTRRLIKADLDRRMAAGRAKDDSQVSTPETERPVIGALPNFPVAAPASDGSIDEVPHVEPADSEPEEEVTENTRPVCVVIPREPPVRK